MGIQQMHCAVMHCIRGSLVALTAPDMLPVVDTCINVGSESDVLLETCGVLAAAAFVALPCRPEVYGVVPMTRFRHTGTVVAPQQSSTVLQAVNQLLHPAKRDASQGSVILLFGGYNTMGQEFGGNKIEVERLQHGHSAVYFC